MVNFQFLSGLKTLGANIFDIQSDFGRVIFDYGELLDNESGELPDFSHSSENTAIFVSHLHIDHVGSFHQIPKEIPIYMSEDSYKLYQLLLDIEEEKPVEAIVSPLAYDEVLTVGDIKVAFKKSDHDIRGASAIFVQTPDVKLINSGDVRLTGNFRENVETWMKEAQAFEPDFLLIEGTSYSFDEEENIGKPQKEESEKDMHGKWNQLLQNNTDEIIFINTYIRDTVRLLNFIKQTQTNGRKMVLEPKFAYLIQEHENFTDFLVLKELDTTEQFKKQWISIDEMIAEPEQYVLQNTMPNFSLMAHFKSGVYCHSNGEPLGDYDPRYETMMDMIHENNFVFGEFSVSGHATKEDLIEIAKTVNAKTTIPWHSFHPERLMGALAEAGLSTLLPERHIVYSLDRINKYK